MIPVKFLPVCHSPAERKPKVAFERRTPTLSVESLSALSAQQSSGTGRSAAASSLLQRKGVFERPSIHQESAPRNAQHKSSNGAAVERVPPVSPPVNHLLQVNQRKRTSDTGGIRAAAEQQAVWFREDVELGDGQLSGRRMKSFKQEASRPSEIWRKREQLDWIHLRMSPLD